MNSSPILKTAVTTYRGDAVENRHIAHVAVVDASGKLLFGFGSPERLTLARSAAKPAQALAIYETGVFDRFAFDDVDLALMCGSHSSEELHIAHTQKMLTKIGLNEADMRCGGHPPLSEKVARAWIKHDFLPSAVCSNCSGKHVGMMAAALCLGAPVNDYHLPTHPLQQRVKKTVAEVCGLTMEEVLWAVDGCNLPTPAFALDRLAFLYAKLAHAADSVQPNSINAINAPQVNSRELALAHIYRAMTKHPHMVAGEGRYCTALMEAFGGELVGKLGADASYAIGVRSGPSTAALGIRGAIGIAVKVEDGNVPMLYAVVGKVLALLQIGSEAQREKLTSFHTPSLRNSVQVETGHVEFSIELDQY